MPIKVDCVPRNSIKLTDNVGLSTDSPELLSGVFGVRTFCDRMTGYQTPAELLLSSVLKPNADAK